MQQQLSSVGAVNTKPFPGHGSTFLNNQPGGIIKNMIRDKTGKAQLTSQSSGTLG